MHFFHMYVTLTETSTQMYSSNATLRLGYLRMAGTAQLTMGLAAL